MKIMDYQVEQRGSSKLEESFVQSKTLTVNAGNNGESASSAVAIDVDAYDVEISTEKTEKTDKFGELEDEKHKTMIKLLEAMLSSLRGKNVKLSTPSLDLDFNKQGKPVDIESNGQGKPIRIQNSSSQPLSNMSIRYQEVEIYERKESVSFSSAGSVKTADGKSINFKMDVNMMRHIQSQNSTIIQIGKQVDPLVVAFGGSVPDLSITKHEFDLDSDGQMDSISMPTKGSGFLAYDKNGNGLIDNGNELFGPQNGDGFEELRVYDSDGNGWIDESDDVFSDLSIMTMQNGEKTLFKLADVGIGAIYLNDVDTEFDMMNGLETQGTMQSSSVFLREDGTAGSIHHIDLNV